MKLLLALLALPMFGADPFSGTWKTYLSEAELTPKPTQIEVADGIYKCMSCDPPLMVKADGTDQPVTGRAGFDTLSVRIIDGRHIEQITKKAGKIVSDEKLAAAADGLTATEEFTTYTPPDGKPANGRVLLRRVGAQIQGSAVSGSWEPESNPNRPGTTLRIVFEQRDNELKVTRPGGATFAAKMDGKQYPYLGSPDVDRVALKRIDAHTLVETDRLGPEVIANTRMTVSLDGETLTMSIHAKSGVTTLVWKREP